MVRKYLSFFIAWSFLTLVALSEVKFFRGACDASAALALDSDAILVADDEDNILRIYSYDDPGLPISSFSLDYQCRKQYFLKKKHGFGEKNLKNHHM